MISPGHCNRIVTAWHRAAHGVALAHQVRVRIAHRHAQRRVSQEFPHRDEVHSPRDEPGRERMTQSVPPTPQIPAFLQALWKPRSARSRVTSALPVERVDCKTHRLFWSRCETHQMRPRREFQHARVCVRSGAGGGADQVRPFLKPDQDAELLLDRQTRRAQPARLLTSKDILGNVLRGFTHQELPRRQDQASTSPWRLRMS